MNDELEENVLNEICLKEGGTFLDACCGKGRFSISASKIVRDTGKVYAIDLFKKLIAC